jgi:hypothetical protein
MIYTSIILYTDDHFMSGSFALKESDRHNFHTTLVGFEVLTEGPVTSTVLRSSGL